MRWHGVLVAFAAAFLPVPLALLLGSAMHAGLQGPPPESTRVSPVLEFEERMRRVTYHRHCQKTSDCEAPLGCLGDARVFTHYCTDSQCVTDEQCPDGLVCRNLATAGGGPLVRFCLPVGLRQQGEKCITLPGLREEACGPGLLCGEGWCGHPCRRDEATRCPEGFFCADVAPEPLCLPTCDARTCPQGQQCIHFDKGVSACRQVYGANCQQAPCPDGSECLVDYASRHPSKVWMECVQKCGQRRPACPEGLVCNRWRCQLPCDPQLPNTCGEGYRCAQDKPDRPWVCQPDQ